MTRHQVASYQHMARSKEIRHDEGNTRNVVCYGSRICGMRISAYAFPVGRDPEKKI